MASAKLSTAGAATTSRVRSAFALAEQHANLAAAGHRDDDTFAATTSTQPWSRPTLLKLPSQSRSEPHWAGDANDAALYYSPSCTPQVQAVRGLQAQFSHPPERSPQVATLRRQQEDFRSPLATPSVRSSRQREERSFRAPPNTPAVSTLRSVESAFRMAPHSVTCEALRQCHEDPFQAGGLGSRAFRTSLKLNGSSLQGPQEQGQAGEQVVLSVRQQMEGFRSEPITPTLVALRTRLEAFITDKAAADPMRAAIAASTEDPFVLEAAAAQH